MPTDLDDKTLAVSLPFQDPIAGGGPYASLLTSLLSSVDFSTAAASADVVRALVLSYDKNREAYELAFSENVSNIKRIFELATSTIENQTNRGVLQLPLTALISVRDYEKILYTRGPLSGLHESVCAMAGHLAHLDALTLRENRKNVISLIFSYFFTIKLAASNLLKPYSVKDAISAFNSFAKAISRDSFSPLLKYVDDLYEYTLECKHVLYEKKRALVRTNEYGFEDATRWEEEKMQYAAELVSRRQPAPYGGPVMSAVLAHFVVAQVIDVALENATDLPSGKSQRGALPSNQDRGVDFEERCIVRLKECGWEAAPTAKSGDKGVDIIASKRGLRVAIQCKDWQSGVGSSAVQEVYTGSHFYDADAAVILSETQLTAQAREMATKLRVAYANAEDIATLEVIIIKTLT